MSATWPWIKSSPFGKSGTKSANRDLYSKVEQHRRVAESEPGAVRPGCSDWSATVSVAPLSTMQARTLALQSRSLRLPVLTPSRTQSKRPQREPVAAFFVLNATRSHGSLFRSPAATLVVDVRGFAIGVIGWSDCAGTRRKPSMRDSQYSLKGEYITPPCRAE